MILKYYQTEEILSMALYPMFLGPLELLEVVNNSCRGTVFLFSFKCLHLCLKAASGFRSMPDPRVVDSKCKMLMSQALNQQGG